MRAVELLIAVVLIIACTVAVWALLRQANKPVTAQDWEVIERESESHPITSVYLTRGNRQEYFGSVDRMDDDYDDKLYAMTAAARDEAVDRNTIRKTLG